MTYLAATEEANALLDDNAFALLLGMMLDQQIPMEKAFTSPAVLLDRLGGRLDAASIAAMDPGELEVLFATPPALHRFPKAMAARAQTLAALVVETYDGDAGRVWEEAATGKDLIDRLTELPGFGVQKAKIFAALLGKQFAVQPTGWRVATEPYGKAGTYQSVADVRDAASLAKVKAYKKAMKTAAKDSATS